MSRAVDALIAEHVFGWLITYGPDSKYGDYVGNHRNGRRDRERVPNYSTSIADAWFVVKKMKEKGFSFSFINDCASKKGCFRAEFSMTNEGSSAVEKDTPMAICKAALNALGVEVKS